MALIFPASPANGARTILAGKEFQFTSPKWKRFKSVVIDNGTSTTVITLDEDTVDGGDYSGI
jgi:hypothetical protein